MCYDSIMYLENCTGSAQMSLLREEYRQWADTPVDQIAAKDIQNFLNERKNLAEKTLLEMKIMIKSILESAYRDGIITKNPASDSRIVIPSKKRTVRKALEVGDIRDIIGGSAPITLSVHRRMMERINRTIDLHGATPHIFRHSYATLLNDAGASVKTIQGIIGHADIQTTLNRYVHTREDKMQEAVKNVSQLLSGGV